MGSLSTVFILLAITCVLVGVALMMAMTSAVQARGQKINWLFVRFFVLKYISDYRYFTIKETGRSGPLFYPFIISMNLALVFTVLGLVLR